MLDQNVVLSALAPPRQRWSYDESADLADFAAAYLVGFARSQGFNDGNKRTGLACALVFVALNGNALQVDGAALYAITMKVSPPPQPMRSSAQKRRVTPMGASAQSGPAAICRRART